MQDIQDKKTIRRVPLLKKRTINSLLTLLLSFSYFSNRKRDFSQNLFSIKLNKIGTVNNYYDAKYCAKFLSKFIVAHLLNFAS